MFAVGVVMQCTAVVVSQSGVGFECIEKGMFLKILIRALVGHFWDLRGIFPPAWSPKAELAPSGAPAEFAIAI